MYGDQRKWYPEEHRKSFVQRDVSEASQMLIALISNWAVVKFIEIDHPENREAVFIKELMLVVKKIEVLVSDFAKNKKIYPDYALEKLSAIKNIIDITISVYEQLKGE